MDDVFLFLRQVFFFVPKYFKTQNKYLILTIEMNMVLLSFLVYGKFFKIISTPKHPFLSKHRK